MALMHLIVGIDPGVTVGYAVLDLHGNLVEVGSERELGLDALVERIRKLGKVVAVGSDKAKVPWLVGAFATKTGAKVVKPEFDMWVSEKKDSTARFKLVNEHEMDALASALFAFKKLQPLFNRVEKLLKRKGGAELADEVKDIVLKKEISVDKAVAVILQG